MGKLHQLHTAVSCSFASILTGLLYVWPSYTLGLYTASDTVLLTAPMADLESSLLGSLPSLGAMFGTVIVGPVISKFGRQKGGVLLALPFLISWIIIDLSRTSIVILVARFIGGIGCGSVLVYSPIFISEIAEESIRGSLASVPMASYCLGVQLSYILGWTLTYRYILWVNLACSVLAVVLILTVTESPVYLLRQNREEDARLAIAHYRSESPTSKVVLEEISRLKQQITPAVELIEMNGDDNLKAEEAEKEKLNLENNTPEVKAKMSAFKILFTSPSSRRAFIVVGSALSLQIMMGMVAVQVYAKHIFGMAAPSLSSHFCSVMFALVIFVGSIVSLIATDKFGRKFLLIISSVSVALCLITMGLFLQTGIVPPWVTALLILVYCFFFMLGAGNVPYVLLAECFIPEFLLITSSVSVALCLITMGLFLQTGIVPPWVTALLILVYCFFFIFGAGNVPYVLLAECFIPEVQSLASTLLMEWVWLLNFFLIGVFPFMIKYFGIHGSFYAFSIFSILNTLVGIFLLPETKGMTKEQIQEALLRRKK